MKDSSEDGIGDETDDGYVLGIVLGSCKDGIDDAADDGYALGTIDGILLGLIDGALHVGNVNISLNLLGIKLNSSTSLFTSFMVGSSLNKIIPSYSCSVPLKIAMLPDDESKELTSDESTNSSSQPGFVSSKVIFPPSKRSILAQ